jgi:multisubunit Na+/H+ antiporter MnhB subunit
MKILTKKALGGLIVGTALAFVAVLSPLSPTVGAVCDETNLSASSGVNCAQGKDTPTTLFGEGSIFTTVVNVLLFVIGAISVIMLIIGGIRYTVSAGDSTNVTAAKNTIMYALIGLVVAFLAFAIVNWVLGALPQA